MDKLLIILSIFGLPAWLWAAPGAELADYQRELFAAGSEMLENLEVSYVYGGAKVGDEKTCDACNVCLEDKRPAPKERFQQCPVCSGCSLDCSHFVQLVFAKAGLGFPYLTSTQMLELDEGGLGRRYQLVPVSITFDGLLAGDLLVYRGHVVIVEKVHSLTSADIIHATGGKDIKLPGQGIQRERFVRVGSFRGELLRVLRHQKLQAFWSKTRKAPPAVHESSSTLSKDEPRFRMRPIQKKQTH